MFWRALIFWAISTVSLSAMSPRQLESELQGISLDFEIASEALKISSASSQRQIDSLLLQLDDLTQVSSALKTALTLSEEARQSLTQQLSDSKKRAAALQTSFDDYRKKVSAQRIRDLVIGGLIGLAVGGGIALLVRR